MSDMEVFDAETGELVPVVSVTLFGTDVPQDVIRAAVERADALSAIVNERNLYTIIQGKKHPHVEAWTLLGSMLGVFAVPEEVEPVEIEGVPGFKATVKAVTRAGEIVGRSTAYCMRDENTWKNRSIHAVAGMAETRATSRALRKPLGFIMKLAGYDATGAEERTDDEASPSEGPKTDNRKVTREQHSKLHAMIADLEKRQPNTDWEALSKDLAFSMFGKKSRADLTVTEMSDLIEALPTADVKF